MDPLRLGQRIRVHWNLHLHLFSVTAAGRVIAHVPAVMLDDVEFRVQPGGLARVRDGGRRLVCAYATGIFTGQPIPPVDPAAMTRVSFNPHRDDTFVDGGGQPVRHAARAIFTGGRGWLPRTERKA